MVGLFFSELAYKFETLTKEFSNGAMYVIKKYGELLFDILHTRSSIS